MSEKADMARTKSSKIPNLTIFFAFYLLILSFSLPAIAQSDSQTHPTNSNNSHSSSSQSSHSQSYHSPSGQSHSQKNNTLDYSNHLQSQSNQSQSQSHSHSPPSAGQAQKSQSQTTNQTPSQTQSAAKSQASATLTMPMYRIRNPNGDIIIKFGSRQYQNEDEDDDLVFHGEEIKNEVSQQKSQPSSNETTLTPPPQATMPPSPSPLTSPPPPSPTTGNQGSTREYRAIHSRVFLEHHNKLRAELNEAPLIWDRKLTHYARRWAAKRAVKCDILHSNGPYGENIFMGEPGKKWTAEMAIKHWMDERAHYDAATNTCEAGEVCGHYTQMIWKGSKKLGCTFVKCANEGVFVQCNYDPPGNYEGDTPFQ